MTGIEFRQPMTMIIVFIVSYALYYRLSNSKAIRLLLSGKFNVEKASVMWVQFQHITGMVLLGALPVAFVLGYLSRDPAEFGLVPVWNRTSLWWMLGLLGVIIPMNAGMARKPANLANYPQMRVKQWSAWLVFTSAFGWLGYLLAYETLFRGLLLFECDRTLGMFPAMVINIGFYVLVHVPKGWKEALGALPFGVVLCWVTLTVGHVWVAFTAHAALALTNEWFALAAQPDMRVRFGKNR